MFFLLTLPAWNPFQGVSHMHLFYLISNADIACMKFYPGSELCVTLLRLISIADIGCMKSHLGSESYMALVDFHCWHCLHKILSREWVMCSSSGLWLMSMADIPCMNFYPGSELCVAPLLDIHCWHCLHEILSRLWVHVWLFFLISIADIIWMKSYPECELCAALLVDFYCWHYLHEIPSREWVMCSSSAWLLLLLTLSTWNSIQSVSCV